MTPGRPVADPKVNTTLKSREPLDVAAIQERLIANPSALAAFAKSARTVALQLVKAVDKRDLQKFSELGGSLDEVCEACHKTFWYPN
jgi:cytochrome c556